MAIHSLYMAARWSRWQQLRDPAEACRIRLPAVPLAAYRTASTRARIPLPSVNDVKETTGAFSCDDLSKPRGRRIWSAFPSKPSIIHGDHRARFRHFADPEAEKPRDCSETCASRFSIGVTIERRTMGIHQDIRHPIDFQLYAGSVASPV